MFTKKFSMANKWTFQIPCVSELVNKYVGDGIGWVDPFAGETSPAEFTNDLNPNRPTKYHMYADEFCNMLNGSFNGVLFDPPYSYRQVTECYQDLNIKATHGFGKKNGFKQIEILLVAHGSHHNDTICVVEKKIK
jgi:hypothetical protein